MYSGLNKTETARALSFSRLIVGDVLVHRKLELFPDKNGEPLKVILTP